MRPSREEVLMEIAQVIARRGTCDRKQVGAVIAREGRIIATGFNGAPPGMPHCSENQHGWAPNPEMPVEDRWTSVEIEAILREKGCRNATHAEANALAFAARYGVSTERAQLFVTVAPCDTCTRLLIAAGIIEVCYLEEYRDGRGLELCRQAGLGISTILPD